MTLGQVASILTIVVASVAFYSVTQDNQTNKTKVERLENEKNQLSEKNNELNEYIKNNPTIPSASTFQKLGISKSLASRYFLLYTQLALITESAGIEDPWLRSRMSEGVLQHVIDEYTITGLDKSTTPPKIAIQMTITIDWEKTKLHAELKAASSETVRDLYEENKTLVLANAFKRIAEDEKLNVKTSVTIASGPTKDALRTLGVTQNPKKITNTEFTALVYDQLNIRNGESLEWREGNTQLIGVISEVTPELSVQLKYVEKKETQGAEK